jgi:hypothetical protein
MCLPISFSIILFQRNTHRNSELILLPIKKTLHISYEQNISDIFALKKT